MRRLKKTFTQAEAAAWRATIPFSNEEIAAALETYAAQLEQVKDSRDEKSRAYRVTHLRSEAAWLRTNGRLKGSVLGTALPMLVKKCAVCGRKALYRSACEGRCSEHRLIPSKGVVEARQRYEARSSGVAANAGEREALLKKMDKGRRLRRSSSTRLRQRQ